MSPSKIVLVDDSVVALEWAKEALLPFGFEVITYNASLGIQSFVRKTQPQVVLLDVNMPGLHGDHVCRMLKDSVQTRDVLVALYSSMPEDELAALAELAGADGHIIKSNDGEALAHQLTQLIGSE